MKRHKDPVNTPNENGDAQVFVLPPDLLKKLGIELSNITCPPEGPEESSIVDQSTKHNAENMPSAEPPSILETANLMKQSVFMSPTFVSSTTTETCELNTPSIVTETEEIIQDVNVLQQFVDIDVSDIDKEDKFEFDSSDINSTYNVKQQAEDFEIYQSVKEIENSDMILTNVAYESRNGEHIDLNSFNKTTTGVDEHADEAYSSDGSHCNSGTGPEIINNNSEIALKQQKPCNKIKILSEQIINHSDLNSVQNSRIKKSSCFLIPVNTIVTGKAIIDSSNNQVDQETTLEELCTIPKIDTEVNNKAVKVDLTNHILETITSKHTMLEDLLSDTCLRAIETPGVIDKETTHNVDTQHKSNNIKEMDLNIDNQITNDADKKNNYLKTNCKDKNLTEKLINDLTNEKVANSKKISGKSKLCIQGVEKPGGICEKNIELKTYQRINIRKLIPGCPRIETNNIIDSSILPKNAIDLDSIYIGGYKNSKSCVCSDYGQLVHYDREAAYEHIHFCDHNSASCNLETLFSMYDDTYAKRDISVTEDIDVVDEDVGTIQHGICWSSFAYDSIDESVEFDTIGPKTLDELNSSPGQLRRSNRKRKSTTEHVIESIESKSKKSVKCGACGLILSETEWNKHKDSEHNFIAWKDGQTIDMKNKNLLKKLGQRLKNLGVLKCAFCKTDIKYLSRFVEHVKQCIKIQVKHISTTSNSATWPNDELAKKDATAKQTKTTRRTSRHLNLESDISDISIENTTKSEINNDDTGASTKQIKLTSLETDTQYLENTPKSTRKSLDVPSKSKSETFVKTPRRTSGGSQKATPKLIHVDVTTISNLVGKQMDTSHLKLTPKVKEFVEVASNATTKSKSITEKSEGTVLAKTSTQKPTNAMFLPILNRLKEIDIFTIPKIKSQPTVAKKFKNETAKTKIAEHTPKSHTKKTLEVKESNKLKGKPYDADLNRDVMDTPSKFVVVEISATSSRNSVDAFDSSEIPRTCTRNIEFIEDDSPTSTTKPQDTSLKSKIKNKLPKNHSKKSPDLIKSEKISDTINDVNQLSKKSNIVSIEVPPVDLPQKSISLEIEIPAYNANIATTDDDPMAKSTTQKVIKTSLTSNSKNDVTHSNKKSITSENSNKPQSVEVLAVSIKQEVLPQCGVCKQQVEDSLWIEHIAKEHDYLAWREDDPPLDLQNEEEVRAHLYAIAKANGGLKCSKCHITRKYVKAYLTHIQNCDGDEEEQNPIDESTASIETASLDDVPLQPNPTDVSAAVVCGVCSETVLRNKWIDHIRLEHKYLAWKSGEPPLDLEDEVAVKLFLKNISNYNGGLICNKCGTVRSYVKSWMAHEATCKGVADESFDSTLNESRSKKTEYIEFEITTETVKCSKCGEEMPSSTWIDHIEKEHNYLSWVEGQPPLDESNPDAVSAYLHSIVRKRGVLYCVKCGVTRKYPKAFLTHVSACEISGFKREDYFVEVSEQVKPGDFECALCHETGNLKDWSKHAMSKHYNVAWMAGDTPINLKNPYAVEKYIKEYRTKHNLICKVCGTSRASCYGFYAHILTCGKSEKELEHLMEICDICNNKFLCIYRNQHRAMHKEQMIKKEKKEQDAIRAEDERLIMAANEEGEPMGKRRAAQKAKKVMEKYTTTNISDGGHVCSSCHVEFDYESQLKAHVCQGPRVEDASDSDDISMKIEEQEESDDDMEGVDSNVSDEEEDLLKKKRQPETIPKIILPFKVKDFNYYLAKSFENFCEMHYTNECLFNNWRRDDYKILSENEWDRYLPLQSESCKLRAMDSEWETYKRFEARRKKDIVIFTGATIRCMQWVPHSTTVEVQDHYLSVSCFRDTDSPRYGKEDLPQHPGMLQIWNIGQFLSTPKLVIGLAHDYGTIWAMDWCPSGARDKVLLTGMTGSSRLGLVAVACSNGCAYILSVPYFQESEEKPIICKLNAVAELRLAMKPTRPPFRIGYQATAISWSPQNGHGVVMVGYADGTTALYDLNTQSTLLKETENGVDIFYPFQDALAENSTVTGAALCASADLQRAVGGVASASVTGATMARWPRGATVRSHLAASSVTYMPNWPAALLCSDDVLTMKSTNEMEWWGGGRRLGGACAAGSCARCGRVCVTAPPFVRVLRAHPVYPELKKQIVATVKMVPIARKRKLPKDNLAVIVEPLTYNEAIKKYGLEFKALLKKDRNVASRLCDNVEQCAERFPLSDMPAAAFCPTAVYHNRLAIATHAGFIFIICT